MKKTYTSEQMRLWGQFSLASGMFVLVFLEFVFQILELAPLDWVWHGVLSVVLLVVAYLYYRLYQRTKEIDKE
jgi:membrane protein implicated in regulation of membrane protease activity